MTTSSSGDDEPLPAEWDDESFQEQLDAWSIAAEEQLEAEHLVELRDGEGLSWAVMRLKHPDLGKALYAARKEVREISQTEDLSADALIGIATDALAGMIGPDATYTLKPEMADREVVRLAAAWMRTSVARDRALLNILIAVIREAEAATAEREE